jgi:thiol:disulfide interchange protein DsbA
MNFMFKKPLPLIAWTLFIIVISALVTTAYFHMFVLGNNENPANVEEEAIRFVTAEQIGKSPIKEEKTIVEVFSYGCHFCAANENNISELESRLPADSKLIRIHLSNGKNTGLASYAPVFATLSVMGIEQKYRESAYKAVIKNNIDLSDHDQLKKWLQQNYIDVQEYENASKSQETKDLLTYMTDVSRYYNIKATPIFIVNKKWLAMQDRDFSEFGNQLLSLLNNDKPLE